jgi:serine/threonine-protein kinase
VAHRDLKPANVHLLDGDWAKLLDFGLAKRMDGTSAIITGEGQVIGTPEYMAPEQCEGRRDLDGRADVYSLGCLLHELVVGAPPFVGETMDVLRAHCEQVPPLDRVPAELRPLLGRALAKTSEARPTMVGFREALREAAARLGARAGAQREMAPSAVSRSSTRSAVALALVGLVGAALIALAGRALRRDDAAKRPLALAARRVSIASAPPGAAVLVDGVLRGATPLEVTLDGERAARVELRLTGYAPWRGAIAPEGAASIEAALSQLAPPAPLAPPTAAPKPKARPARAEPPHDRDALLRPAP